MSVSAIEAPPTGENAPLGAASTDPCTKRTYCRMEAGHPGLCRRHPPGSAEAAQRQRKKARERKRAGGPAAQPAAHPSASPRRPTRAPAAPQLAAPVLGGVWAKIGQAIEAAGPEPAGPPVGRVMQFQAADAGERLHQLLSRVPVYRRAMLVVGGGISEQIAALIGPPMLAAVMAQGGEAAQAALWPVFASMLQSAAVSMAKAEKEQIRNIEAVSEYSEQVGAMMAQLAEVLFAPRDDSAGQGQDRVPADAGPAPASPHADAGPGPFAGAPVMGAGGPAFTPYAAAGAR